MDKETLGRILLVVFGLLISLLVTMTFIWFLYARLQKPSQTNFGNFSAVTKHSQPATEQDPLTIAAIKARSYPGSLITTVQELGNQSGCDSKIVSFQADGLKEYALLNTPPGAAPSGGWPVIILNHGYINPSIYQTNGAEYKTIIAALCQAGYMVVKPDYRGHGNSQGVPEGGHFSPAYTYDELNLIASLKQYPGINPERIGILGHSLGGHVTARAIVTSPDVKASAIMAGVVGDFNDLINNWPNSPMPYDKPEIVQTKKQEYLQKYGNPQDNPNFWNSVSALDFASNIQGPVLVIHDSSDSTVPKTFSDHFVAALQAANKAVDYKLYPGDDHQFTANRAQLLQDLIAFYRANL